MKALIKKSMITIKSITGEIITDSRGKKTVGVFLATDVGKVFASVPSGTSRGKYEANELPCNDAIEKIKNIINPFFKGRTFHTAVEVDNLLLNLDSTKNKSYLGVNSILAVSIAAFRMFANNKKIPLWDYIAQNYLKEKEYRSFKRKVLLPKPLVLMVEGGLHGKTDLAIQEFMVAPEGDDFKKRFSRAKKIYNNLKKILRDIFGRKGIQLGLEGAFTPPIEEPIKVLDLIMKAAGRYNIKIGLDCAASHFKKGGYKLDFYKSLIESYPLIFIEDPFDETDWAEWKNLKKFIEKENSETLVVGDDLTVTNLEKITLAKKNNLCNAVIIKPNQIGTVSEAMKAVSLARSYGWKIIVSHRSGETKDDFIADFAVGVGADFIKSGAPFAKERVVKYERLLQIEHETSS